MTEQDKQIYNAAKDAAREWANKHLHQLKEQDVDDIATVFYDGYHCRDEEIKELQNSYHEIFRVLAEKIESLQNPWITPKAQLPTEHDNIIVMFTNNSMELIEDITIGHINNIKDNPEIKQWMIIPSNINEYS